MEGRAIIVWTLAGIGIFVIVGYSIFALGGFVQGPQIELRSPESGFATTSPLINLSGRVLRANILTLNGATSSIDLAGNFNETLLLAKGYNTIELKATDHYNRSTRKTIELVLNQRIAPTQSTTTATTTRSASSSTSIINI